ncbi:MAG: hypothetical protein AABX24_03920 [Nanoarchaeota archaeon]|mgnify:CR=1 FL=1
MGIQGEIYNVLGLKIPATRLEDRLYDVCGKRVSDWKFKGEKDFESCIKYPDLDNPELSIRIMGHNASDDLMGRHFERNALVGYAIANESYQDNATALPPQRKIDALKPRLVKEIKEKLGYDAQVGDLEIFLVFDWLQGSD